jgi:hypothetical protein
LPDKCSGGIVVASSQINARIGSDNAHAQVPELAEYNFANHQVAGKPVGTFYKYNLDSVCLNMVEQGCEALSVLKLLCTAYTLIPVFPDYFQAISFGVFADSLPLSWETILVYLSPA